MVNKKRLLKLTQRLIQVNSENPPGNEVKIAAFVTGYLRRMGLRPKTVSFKANRPNVLATLHGKNAKHSLLITPHLDTVPAGRSWNVPAFSGKVINGRLYGLGATDCKCNLACAMEAMHCLIEKREVLPYDLIFAATADEETGSDLGLIPLLKNRVLSPDAAVVLDADDFDIVVTQKGLIHIKIKIQGKRAHGAYPWMGVNAIDIALKIITEIKALKQVYRKNKYLRAPTINIGTIHGGDKVNVVADWCEFELDFRYLPGSKAQNILGKVRTIIAKHTKHFKIEVQGIQQPYYIRETHSLIAYLKNAMRYARAAVKIRGSEGATVITFFQHKNIPAIATGFGCGGCAHTADEYVKVQNLYKGAEILEEFLRSYRF